MVGSLTRERKKEMSEKKSWQKAEIKQKISDFASHSGLSWGKERLRGTKEMER